MFAEESIVTRKMQYKLCNSRYDVVDLDDSTDSESSGDSDKLFVNKRLLERIVDEESKENKQTKKEVEE